jgi:hypothetical protein
MHRRPTHAHRLLPAAIAIVTLGGAVASCNQILGLEDFKNCPQDPGCPSPDGGDPTCTDGEKNGQETDIDCGGSSCPRCADGKACDVGSDCAGGTCSDGTCRTATCTDGEKNGQETDIDCGGPACGKCADDKGCSNGSDCTSKVCSGGTCLAPTCGDMVQNGTETDVDCGGSSCGKCDVGKGCAADGDCKGGSCAADKKCAATCTDGVKDGNETDVDCGGAACPKCAVTQGCATGPDCDSGVCQGGACVDYFEWAKQFGDSNNQIGSALAADAFDNLYVASAIRGTVNFGGADLVVPTSANYLALAKLTSAGAHTWSKIFASAPAEAAAIAVDEQGNTYLTGTAATGINFGGGALTGFGTNNFFVARFDTGGNHVTSKLFPNGNGTAVAVGSTRYAVTGSVSGSVDLGCGAQAAKGSSDAIIASYNRNNNTCAWSKRFADSGGTAIGVAASGDILVAGFFDGTIDVGCGSLMGPPGTYSAFVAVLAAATGACTWSKAFAGPNNDPLANQYISGIGADAAGNITIVGSFYSSMYFDSTMLTNSGGSDMFAAQLDATGEVRWVKQFASPSGSGIVPVLSLGASGKLAIAGRATAGTDFGSGPLAKDAPFVAELDANGQHLWSKGFPSVALSMTVPSRVNGIAFAGAQHVVITGALSGELDFGNGPMNSIGGIDVFLAKLLVP